jgi:hypothetical protein
LGAAREAYLGGVRRHFLGSFTAPELATLGGFWDRLLENLTRSD